MKLSKKTFDILTNFSKISNGIYIKPGNKIAVKHPLGHIVAMATVEETFPMECALYDLSNLLGAISSFGKDKVELIFEPTSLVVSESETSTTRLRFTYSPKKLVTNVDDDFEKKTPVVPDNGASFTLTADQINLLSSMIGSLRLSHVRFTVTNDGEMLVTALDPQNESSRSFVISLTPTSVRTSPFKCIVRWENVLLLKGGYDVSVSQRYITFASESATYWVTAEVMSR